MEKRVSRWLFSVYPWAWILMLASLLTLIVSIYSLYAAHVYNSKLASQSVHKSTDEDAIFANAMYWDKHNNPEKALKLYALVQSSHDSDLSKAAHYNIANIYLRQAYDILNNAGLSSWDKVSPLLSIAKESYREALRVDPGFMDAKYNYELALRLIPTIESKTKRLVESEENLETPPEGWPALPGFPRGMP